jgi:hypothetical protein
MRLGSAEAAIFAPLCGRYSRFAESSSKQREISGWIPRLRQLASRNSCAVLCTEAAKTPQHLALQS